MVRTLLLSLCCLAVPAALACGSTRQTPVEAAPNPSERQPSDVDREALLGPEKRLWMPTDGLPCEGPPDAAITVVEYVGYQCPFTRRLQPTVERLLREHEGQVRFCVRHFVIPADQPHGELAAQTALETFRQRGSEVFFHLHRALLATELSEEIIFDLAAKEGVDTAEIREALESNRHAGALEKDRGDLLALARSGTPQLFVAGRLISGARPYEDIAVLFHDSLEEARRLVAAGVDPADLYGVVQKNAVRQVEREKPRPGEPAKVRIRFIHVPTSKHPLATEARSAQEAHELANQIAQKVRDGEDFGALARQHSVASNKERGGEFGTIVRGTLTQELEDVAFALNVDEVGVTCGPLACQVIQRQE